MTTLFGHSRCRKALDARSVLQDDFVSPQEISASCGVLYTERQLYEFDSSLPDLPVIEHLRDNGMMLVAGPPTAMSLVDVRALHADYFYSKGPDQDDSGWYDEPSEKFATTDKVKALAWIAVRKEAVEDSFSKNWSGQRALVQAPMVIPNAAEAVWALTTYKAVRDVYLLENRYVRTSSVDSDDDHVYVGYFCAAGLRVNLGWDGEWYSCLGVSAAREF